MNYFISHMLPEECGYTAGQFSKLADDVFHVKEDERDYFLIPNAKTGLVNLHRDEILNEDQLTRKYFSYTPCYRREAGGHRADKRGIIRGHQLIK